MRAGQVAELRLLGQLVPGRTGRAKVAKVHVVDRQRFEEQIHGPVGLDQCVPRTARQSCQIESYFLIKLNILAEIESSYMQIELKDW